MDAEIFDTKSPATEVRGNEISDTEILDWYLGLRNRTLDLVGDYAGNERFLLEGDSLLLHCFSDTRIDVEGEPYSTYPSLLPSLINPKTSRRFPTSPHGFRRGKLPRISCATAMQLSYCLLQRFVFKYHLLTIHVLHDTHKVLQITKSSASRRKIML